jgi:hypothetical protein
MEAFTRNCEGQLIWTEGKRIAGHCLTLRFAIGQFDGKGKAFFSERKPGHFIFCVWNEFHRRKVNSAKDV